MPRDWSVAEEDSPEVVVMVSIAHNDLMRARTALRRAIASEESKYNPSESLLKAFRDGLIAVGG